MYWFVDFFFLESTFVWFFLLAGHILELYNT